MQPVTFKRTMAANQRIVQTWRTAEFPAGSPHSKLEVHLEPVEGGTRVTIHNTELPEGDGPKYTEGWEKFYFEPMGAYFGGGPSERSWTGTSGGGKQRGARKAAAKKAPAKKAAAKKAPAKKAAAKKAPAKKAAKKA